MHWTIIYLLRIAVPATIAQNILWMVVSKDAPAAAVGRSTDVGACEIGAEVAVALLARQVARLVALLAHEAWTLRMRRWCHLWRRTELTCCCAAARCEPWITGLHKFHYII